MNTIQPLVEQLFDLLMNPWVIFGFAAQGVFFSRVVIQWVVSEKKKRIVVPVTYWYLGILGSVMIFIYAIHREDVVFIASGFLNSLICIRSLIIHKKDKKRMALNMSS